ncbi:hypothetical protein LWC08_09700 [Desulfobaculum bizertense]|uniref:hypothetical protein n=1 Tax=Desulfobaculum bizertense TaxID=376490 RepID=UPI001F3BFA04|nr:hypothetical protein [Desulfobaculum bizertense]UIJ37012.1 hypothetical protein LWC08_09700 [Desulfobaculum bizertense]
MKKAVIGLLFSLFAVTCLLNGCGYREGVTIPDKKAYVLFSGDTDGVVAYIDEYSPVVLGSHYYKDSMGNKRVKSTETHYELAPGKHRIVLVRNGEKVLERVIMIGNQMTTEIAIP